MNPREPQFYANRAAVYFANGELEKCLSDCRAALELDPSCVSAIIRASICYWTSSRAKLGIETLKTGLRHSPANPMLRHNLDIMMNSANKPPTVPVTGTPLVFRKEERRERERAPSPMDLWMEPEEDDPEYEEDEEFRPDLESPEDDACYYAPHFTHGLQVD
jgi:hypothetical protein